MAEAGIRELRDNLSQYLTRVRAGEHITVTDRGRAVARITPIAEPRPFDRLVAAGLITPAPQRHRTRPSRRQQVRGTVSDLVADQRR
jgi:prevent-host-death family protein